MDIPNAFLGSTHPPTDSDIEAALGPTLETWKLLIGWLIEHGGQDQEWISSSPKYGWSLRIKKKKRAIVYLAPCRGSFRVSLALGDKAMAAARRADLPQAIQKVLDEATRYAEGTGLRFMVNRTQDLDPIRILALIKMAN